MTTSAYRPARLALLLSAALAAPLGPTQAAEVASPSLQDIQSHLETLPQATIYVAKRILTMDPRRSTGAAVAVIGERILAVGSLDDLKHAAGDQPFVVDETFKDKVLVPGFIDQHLHPLLSALTLSAEVIAIEDWVMPDGTRAGVRDQEGYRTRLREADARLTDPKALLLTWGYHPSFHGPLGRTDLDAINPARPIILWHRSGQELFLNGAALERYGITTDFLAKQDAATRSQADLAAGHFWGQGALAVLPQVGPAIASPERLSKGLAFIESYLHASGITTIAAPGSIVSRPMQEAQNAVLGDASTPFRTFFIPDGKSLAERTRADPERLLAETRSLLDWGSGKTAFLPKQVKLFTDGGIFSQSMQIQGGYTDGREGTWTMDPELFAQAFEIFWDADYQIHVQVDGDAALELVVDTLERQMRRHPRYDHRTTVVHSGLSSEDQVKALARLGTVIAANPYHVTALADSYADEGLGSERSDTLARLGSMKRAGLPITLHSDMPMAPARPLLLMWSAVNRTTFSGRVAGPDQRLAAEDALAAVTINAAYSLRLEYDIGSIEPGKLANFTVLESDPLSVPTEQMATVGVWGTVLEGRIQPVARPTLPARTADLPRSKPGQADAVPASWVRWALVHGGHDPD